VLLFWSISAFVLLTMLFSCTGMTGRKGWPLLGSSGSAGGYGAGGEEEVNDRLLSFVCATDVAWSGGAAAAMAAAARVL
jgi:hypothetical protein